MLHYAKSDTGSYYVETGALIGHEAVDVMAWIEANPEYRGSIFFERWDFEGSIEVSSEFYPEASAEVPAIGTCLSCGAGYEAETATDNPIATAVDSPRRAA